MKWRSAKRCRAALRRFSVRSMVTASGSSRVGEVSMELCGGTHVSAAGDIGFFKIVSEGGIAAGVRRIEAVTGTGAVRFVQEMENEQNKLAGLVKAEGGGILDRVERILARQKELQREVETLQAQLNAGKSADMLAGVREINGVKALAAEVAIDDVRKLRELADSLKDRLGSGILALGANIGGKATLLVTVSSDLVPRFSAGSLIREMAPIIGGSGGGKPEMAQAGGSNPEKLPEALEKLYTLSVDSGQRKKTMHEMSHKPEFELHQDIQMKTILIVDDEAVIRDLCSRALKGYTCCSGRKRSGCTDSF